jgi:hypothetical protein
MDLNFFENDIFCQKFYINFNKILYFFYKIFKRFFNDLFESILGIFPKK